MFQRAAAVAPCLASVSSQAAAECNRYTLPEQQGPLPSPPYLRQGASEALLVESGGGDVALGGGIIIGSGGINCNYGHASRRVSPAFSLQT